MGTLGNDLRYAWRQLRRSPGFTLMAVLTLALGIGANAAMFSVIDQVLLRKLPYADPSRLVAVGEVDDQGRDSTGNVSLPDAEDWQARSHTLSDVGFYTFQQPTLRGIDNPRLMPELVTSVDFFSVLGVAPAMGRAFLPHENKGDRTHVLVICDAVWHKQFGGDPHILGRVVELNDTPYTVVGVLPASFSFQGGNEFLFSPLDTDLKDLQSRDGGFLHVLGRLAPGATPDDVRRELNGIKQQAIHQYEKERAAPIYVKSYELLLTESVRPALLALDGAVLAVWLIACANVAGLLLTRTSGRRREIAVRSALGAGNARLLRQFLTESLLLALAGGAVGLGFAAAALHVLRHYLGSLLMNGEQIHINAAVCGYLLLASCASAVLFGIVPAWQAARLPAQEGLREGSAAAGTSQRQRWLRDALVSGEIALSVVLLVAAGLMLRSLYALRHATLGFAPEHVVTAGLVLPQKNFWLVSSGSQPGTPNVVQSFYQPLLERMRQLPGVETVGVSTVRPLQGNWSFSLSIEVAGRPKPARQEERSAACRAATGEYFSAMGIRLLRGRLFNTTDAPGAPMAAVVNQTFVRTFFGNENPLGQGIRISEKGSHQFATIVGVVDDAKQIAASEPAQPEISFNLLQFTPADDLYPILVSFRTNLAIRARTAPDSLIPAMERTVHSVNAAVAVDHPESMQQVVDDSLGSEVLAGRLLTIFGITALLIATAGIYGLLAYQVSQRTREMGVRIALGAQRTDVLWLILRHALVLLGVGVATGLVLAMSAGRVIGSFLYGVNARDIVTAAVACSVLAIAGLVASYLPARRASRIDPVEALRTE